MAIKFKALLVSQDGFSSLVDSHDLTLSVANDPADAENIERMQDCR